MFYNLFHGNILVQSLEKQWKGRATIENFYEKAAILFSDYTAALIDVPSSTINKVTDIYFHVGSKPILFLGRERYTLCNSAVLSATALQEMVFKLCDYSLYKHAEEIKNGFISVAGKYRVGICGTAVANNGNVDNIKNITSLIMRIPRTIYGAADALNGKANNIYKGVLLVGEPSSGKTTILRDMVHVSAEKRIVVLDERFELTGIHPTKGFPVLYGYPKSVGIVHAIRNLGAEIIFCDELEQKDIPAVETAVSSGVALTATVHGTLQKEQTIRPLLLELVRTGAFFTIAELKGRDAPGAIRKIWEAGEFLEIFGRGSDHLCRHFFRNCKGTLSNAKDRSTQAVPRIPWDSQN